MRVKLRPHEPIWDCFKYAFIGLWQALRTERNLRIHFVAGFLAVAVGLALRLSTLEFAVLTLIIVLVIALEIVNSAFEAVIDLVSPEPHPLAGYVKDVGSAAVLVAAIGAVAIGALLFLPHLIPLLSK